MADMGGSRLERQPEGKGTIMGGNLLQFKQSFSIEEITIFNRPVVARAVLQTHWSLNN